MLSFLGTGNKAPRYVGIICLALGVAISAKLLIGRQDQTVSREQANVAEQPAAAPPVAATPVQNAGLDDPTPPVPVGLAPSIATARISPNGDAVIAGHADPAAEITLLDGETIIGTVIADQLGEWVLLPTDPLRLGTHLLWVSARHPDQAARTGERDIALAIFALAATPDEPSPGARVQAVALSVPHAGFGASTVLQVPEHLLPPEGGNLSVALIDYTQSGIIALAGHARPGAQVKVTLGEKLLGSTDASAQGMWHLDVQSRNPGSIQQIRAEQVDEQGGMTGLVELSFDQAAGVGDLPIGESLRVVAVGEGWRITRRVARGATQYTLVLPARPVSANRKT